jgi:hypothetical protein
MGAINYRSSEYISIGLDVRLDRYDWELDAIYQELMEIVKKYDWYYFHIEIISGYYEGFYINIDNNFPVEFDSWEDRRDAQKEVTQVKRFLNECVDKCGLIQYIPGWCMSYSTKAETKAAIKVAIQ